LIAESYAEWIFGALSSPLVGLEDVSDSVVNSDSVTSAAIDSGKSSRIRRVLRFHFRVIGVVPKLELRVTGSLAKSRLAKSKPWHGLCHKVLSHCPSHYLAAGGVVSNTIGTIGFSAGSTGLATVTGSGSQWNNSADLRVGTFGNGTLNVEAGGVVSNTIGTIGFSAGSTGLATVTDPNSQWNNSGNLDIAPGGTGTLNIADSGLVTVGGTTTIGASGTVNLTGGRFEFGETTLGEFSTINAVSGSMAGNLPHSGITDVSTLAALQNTAVDITDVTLTNSGTLYGNASLGNALINTVAGEVETVAGERMRFAGTGNTNAGEINNFGGNVRFDQDLANLATGFIAGRGQFIANGGWTNEGVMAFSGTTDILGDINNAMGGQIVTSGAVTTTIHDDLVHNGTEIHTSAGSNTVIFGAASGVGPYTGTGPVFFEGDLRLGNSAAIVSFDGDVVFGSLLSTHIEISGTQLGDFDRLEIAGDLFLAGSLFVDPINGFQLSASQQIQIADVQGNAVGTFDGLAQGALVGTFGNTDLFINYAAGDGNDISLVATLAGDFDFDGDVDGFDFLNWQRDPSVGSLADWKANYGMGAPLSAATAAVPEPTTSALALLALCLAMSRRRAH